MNTLHLNPVRQLTAFLPINTFSLSLVADSPAQKPRNTLQSPELSAFHAP